MPTSSTAVRHPVQSTTQSRDAIPSRLRGRDYGRIAAIQRTALPYALNKFGYPIKGSEPSWEKVRDQDRQWYQYIVFKSRKTGEAWPSYATMAEDRECSVETAQRYMRRLEHMGFITKEHAFDEKSGDFTSNRYRPVNPLEPKGDAIAIQYRDKVIRCKQIGEIPELPEHHVRLGKPKTPREPKIEERPPLVILKHFYKQVAEQEGMYDLVDQSKAWAEFEKARRTPGQIKRKENPNAYFRGIVRKLVAQARIAAAEGDKKAAESLQKRPMTEQATIPFVQVESPAAEERQCKTYMMSQAVAFLVQGYTPAETLHRLIKHPQLPRYTRLHTPKVDDWAAIVEAAIPKAEILRQEQDRRRRPLEVSSDTLAWLRRAYQDLMTRPGAFAHGAPTTARTASMISLLPYKALPEELHKASAEQIEALIGQVMGM